VILLVELEAKRRLVSTEPAAGHKRYTDFAEHVNLFVVFYLWTFRSALARVQSQMPMNEGIALRRDLIGRRMISYPIACCLSATAAASERESRWRPVGLRGRSLLRVSAGNVAEKRLVQHRLAHLRRQFRRATVRNSSPQSRLPARAPYGGHSAPLRGKRAVPWSPCEARPVLARSAS
jgi:hypothetical protein